MGLALADGSIACGGNHFERQDGQERHFSAYLVRNFDPREAIDIVGIRVYDARGEQVADYPADALPATFNKVLAPGEHRLPSHATALWRSHELIPKDARHPFQVIFDWSAAAGVWGPVITHSRLVRTLDNEGRERDERARNLAVCLSLESGS